MKDFASFLLHVAQRLKNNDEVTVHIDGADIKVAWVKDSDDTFSTIEISYESDESYGVIYKIGNTEQTRETISNYDKSDYFNQNLVSPLILEYDEFKQVLVAYSNLDKLVHVEITEVLYEIIKDK